MADFTTQQLDDLLDTNVAGTLYPGGPDRDRVQKVHPAKRKLPVSFGDFLHSKYKPLGKPFIPAVHSGIDGGVWRKELVGQVVEERSERSDWVWVDDSNSRVYWSTYITPDGWNNINVSYTSTISP